jgi:hypothetical protein
MKIWIYKTFQIFEDGEVSIHAEAFKSLDDAKVALKKSYDEFVSSQEDDEDATKPWINTDSSAWGWSEGGNAQVSEEIIESKLK